MRTPSTAPDRLQPTLVPRFGFRRQVSASVRLEKGKLHTALLCAYYRGSLQHFPYADQIRKGKGQGRALGGPPDAQLQKVAPVNVAADKWFKYPGTQKVGQYTLDFNVVLQKAGTDSFRTDSFR